MPQFLSHFNNPDDLESIMKLIKDIKSPTITVEKYLKLYASKGNLAAQIRLGNIYYFGDDIQKDLKKALKYYQQAAMQGYNYAQFSVGLMYYNGQGVKQSYSKALKYLL